MCKKVVMVYFVAYLRYNHGGGGFIGWLASGPRLGFAPSDHSTATLGI
jgi:hypothetical protein